MALDKEYLVGVAAKHSQHRTSQTLEFGIFVGCDLERAGGERDGVEINPPHALAQLVVVANLFQGVGAFEPIHRRRVQRLIEIVVGGALVVDNVPLARNGHGGRR